jgi:Kef-type K+ transport system membrane component KefB
VSRRTWSQIPNSENVYSFGGGLSDADPEILENPIQFESLFLEVIVQLTLIVGLARVVGALFRRIRQPQVCGEIAAGLALGPSVLGALSPNIQRALFDPAAMGYIDCLSQIGLVFLMFLIGLDFDFRHLARSRRTALSISFAGIVLPFLPGIILGRWMHSEMNLHIDARGFGLFVATALSITAMPVLGRIMLEFNMAGTRVGVLTMTAAAVDDALGWLLLTLVSSIVGSQFHLRRLLLTSVEVVSFLLLMIFVVRPVLQRWVRKMMCDHTGELSMNALTQVIVLILAAAAITNLIGIFSLFGAFTMGGILYDQTEFRAAVNHRLRDFVTVFFLPIFFACTGLRTDVGSMRNGRAWAICAVVVLVASLGKFGGCSFAAKLNGMTWREASIVGTLMNTRGLMELVVLNVGYDLGIIPKPVFFIMVMMALVTTYMAAPLLSRLIPGTEVEPHFEASSFGKQGSVVAAKDVSSAPIRHLFTLP